MTDKKKLDNVIGHAIAYVDVFMVHHDPDECSELRDIFVYSNAFSSQEIVSIIKESVRRNNFVGKEVVLSEMNRHEFNEYIRLKLDLYKNALISA
jgi:hypothetical protein